MDFRQYLLDFYKFRRNQTRHQLRPYSYSHFAAAANIKSPNYLKMIIDGKRNLSEDMIGKFARAMNLNKSQATEFRLLVLFNQSADPAERNLLLKDLSDFRVQGKIKRGELDRKSFEKLPSWVAWVIYAMIDQQGVSFDSENLRVLLRGKVKPDEIESALKSLIEAGEVEVEEATGRLRKTRSLVDSPEDIPVALIRKLQAQLMLLGLESLYQDSPTEREFGTLTLALTASEFEEIRFKLRQLRKQIHKENSIRRMTNQGERVYQLNLQLFPVTSRADGAQGSEEHP
ncbi:MAG: TIGR02147 family protein [Bdellovibrio sp.]|nr:MAG: TIGR02147 family protein [Bdellovibrio sp.]